MNKDRDDLEKRIDQAFSILAFTVNRQLIDHMRRVAVDFGMDFELAYIYGTLAHLNIAASFHPGCQPEDVLKENGRVKGLALVPARLSDVTQVSGLPRETVRRKLLALESAGKAEKLAEGLWQIDPRGVDEHVYEFTKETIRRYLRTADEMYATLGMLKT